jgi:hypothetical protein
MRALSKILRYRVVVGSRQLASQVSIPCIKEFAVFRDKHMNIEPLPGHMLVSGIEMPASFRSLILNQRAVRQHGLYLVAFSHHSR